MHGAFPQKLRCAQLFEVLVMRCLVPLAFFVSILELSPAAVLPRSAVARAEIRQDAARKVVKSPHCAAPGRPGDSAQQLQEGRRQAGLGAWHCAVQAFTLALRVRPNDETVLTEIAEAELALQRFDDAEAHAQLALKNSRTDFGRARILFQLGRIVEARRDPTDYGAASERLAEQAASRFRQSLKLRLSDEVLSHLLAMDENADEIPCRTPQPWSELIQCLKRTFGRTSVSNIEEREPLTPGVRPLSVGWVPQRGRIGDHTMYLALERGGGWRIVHALGRTRESAPLYIRVSFQGATRFAQNGTDYLQVDYTRIESEAGSNAVGYREIEGLAKDDSLRYEDTHIHKRRLYLRFATDGTPVVLEDVVIGQTDFWLFESTEHRPAPVRQRIARLSQQHCRKQTGEAALDAEGKVQKTALREVACDGVPDPQ